MSGLPDSRERARQGSRVAWVLGSAMLAVLLALSALYPARALAPITKQLVPIKRYATAKLRGEVFTCAALTGRSAYNICINSDLTVSCNCQDFSGRGKIGSLREHSLTECSRGRSYVASSLGWPT